MAQIRGWIEYVDTSPCGEDFYLMQAEHPIRNQ
jgi:hypothetical protein